MGKYADAAIAAYQARLQEEADAEQAQKDALVAEARAVAAPLWTDKTGKVVLGDATKETRVELIDEDAGLVVLSVLNSTGGIDASFGLYPRREPAERFLVSLVDDEWQRGPAVADLDDVGEALTEGGAA